MRSHTVSGSDVDLAVVDEGEGPVVLMIHGFPELAYSWRHQLPAVAGAGYRAVAYDQRGYGKSSKPASVDAYGIGHLVSDVIRLLDTLEVERATLVGHDWGGIVMWSTAVMHPERVSRIASIGAPYRGYCAGFPSIETIRERAADRLAYILAFQETGVPENVFAASPEQWLRALYMSAAADPAFLDEEDFAVYLEAFESGGISGPVAYYRNIDANAVATAHLAQRMIDVPTLMVTSDRDPVVPARLAEGMERWVPDLRRETITECGHWAQQEQPDRVNDALVGFLEGTA